jgi:hypothetical protein
VIGKEPGMKVQNGQQIYELLKRALCGHNNLEINVLAIIMKATVLR